MRSDKTTSPWLAALFLAATALPAHAHIAPVPDGALSPGRALVSRDIRTGAGIDPTARASEMSDEEYLTFSGVGAMVCTAGGKRLVSTAFLVGAFDIAVTVGHTFEPDMAPEHCVYNTTDSLGQVRERIPVAYIKSQWDGQAAHDVAVVRLSRPSRFAQRTMPLGRFSGVASSVLMIGFRADMDVDTVKRKSRGRIYERGDSGPAVSSADGFTHDMDSHGIAPGAPVIDERSGVIIGIHTRVFPEGRRAGSTGRNAVVTMDEWLERTLRAEMQTRAEAAAP